MHELLEADNQHLDDATARRLADEEHKHVDVDRQDEAELLKVCQEEVIEALDDGRDRRNVELPLFVIVLAARCLDGKVDVLHHREEDLAENFAPDLQSEDVDSLLKHLEEDVKGIHLVLVLLVKGQVCQVGQNGEPKSLLHTQQ